VAHSEVQLPPREHAQGYGRKAIPEAMIVPELY
jgi:hypothetical protein